MKTLILSVLFFYSLSLFAHDPSDGDHTTNFCSTETSNVCAHLKFLSVINTETEGEFILHILPGASKVEAQNVSVLLWMQMGNHGHGTAPVDLEALEDNHYKITNAWFVMAGTWQVKVNFNIEGVSHQIIIPVEVKE